MDLGSCRHYEGGEIPWTAIREYADEYEFDEDQRVILFSVIRGVDIWFLKYVQAQSEKKNAGTKPIREHGGRGKKVFPIAEGS